MEEEEHVPFVDETFDVIPVGVINNIANTISQPTPEGTSTEGMLQPEPPKYEDLPSLTNPQEIGLGGVEGQQPQVPTTDLVEEDMLFMSEMLWSLPQLYWNKLPDRNPKQIAMFNKALYKYCLKKGIDPNDYFFDEFGLIMASVTIGVGIKKDHGIYYKGKDDGTVTDDTPKVGKPLTTEEKLNIDFEHKKEVDEQKQLDELKEREENSTYDSTES